MAKPTDIKQAVFDNLNSAEQNGAFLSDGSLYNATVDEIADDMVALSADFDEGFEAAELRPFIIEWLAEKTARDAKA